MVRIRVGGLSTQKTPGQHACTYSRRSCWVSFFSSSCFLVGEGKLFSSMSSWLLNIEVAKLKSRPSNGMGPLFLLSFFGFCSFSNGSCTRETGADAKENICVVSLTLNKKLVLSQWFFKHFQLNFAILCEFFIQVFIAWNIICCLMCLRWCNTLLMQIFAP